MRNPLAFNLLGPGTSQSIFYSDLGLSFNDLLKDTMVEGRRTGHQPAAESADHLQNPTEPGGRSELTLIFMGCSSAHFNF